MVLPEEVCFVFADSDPHLVARKDRRPREAVGKGGLVVGEWACWSSEVLSVH